MKAGRLEEIREDLAYWEGDRLDVSQQMDALYAIKELLAEVAALSAALEQAAMVPDLVVDEYEGKTSGWGYSEQWSGFTDAAERIERKILALIEGCA